jgi:hypothetical protein
MATVIGRCLFWLCPGCEAEAPPRRSNALYSLGYALGGDLCQLA